MIDFLSEAAKFTRLGLAIFPCAAGGKVPAIRGGHGCKDATVSEAIIRLWSREYPNANIGLACGGISGGLVVVDVDPRHGGHASIAALALAGRCFPVGPKSITGNGGEHLFFRYDGKLANSKGKMGAGIDIRSDGGYVVAPPSWLAPSKDGKGGRYEWVISPWDAMVPRLPIWVSALLAPRPPKPYVPPKTFEEGASRLKHLAEFAQKASAGERNNSLFWAACRAAELAIDGKASPSEIRERMKIAGQMAGLSTDEIEKTIESALRTMSTKA